MSRTLWFVAGAATSTYALVKARRAAEALTPEGISDRLAGLSRGAQLFSEEVHSEMAARETDLRERLGLRPDGPAELTGGPAARPEAPPPGVRPMHLTREGSN